MKDRIRQIMLQERLNQKDFAATTGISPATLSSIFNGRTSPTLNHAEALHKRFPKLNMSWLMFGEGDMYVKDTPAPSGDQNETTDTSKSDEHSSGGYASNDLSGAPTLPLDFSGGDSRTPVIREVVKYVDKPQRRITEIRIFFDDGTYETFPGK